MDVETEPVEGSSAQPTGKRTGPESDLRKAAEHHANTATVLAGFAFAAVILVMQQTGGSKGKGQAAVSFLVAVFGYVICAFLFAVVAGDLKLSARPRGTFYLASVATLISCIHILYGLNYLMGVYLPNLVYLSRLVLILAALFATVSLLSIEAGLARFYDPAPHTRRELLLFVAPSLAIVGIAAILSLTHAVSAGRLSVVGFPVAVGLSLLFIAVSTGWATVVHGKEEDYRLPPRINAGWAFVVALLFSLMILMS
jgi:hypothetical protein